MKNNTFQEIWKELKNSKKVLMALHPKPDGDSLGSCVAMKSALEEEGVEVKLISRDSVSDNLKIFYSDEIEFGIGVEDFDSDDFDFFLFLDHGSLEAYFSENFSKNKKVTEKIINIDHHETNSFYGKLNYVNKKSPSCASVIVEMFMDLKIEFNEKICRALLLGICTDTNFGEYGDSADSFEKMAVLIKTGNINFQKEFVVPILKSNSWELKKLHGILLSNMERKVVEGKNIFYSYASKEDQEKYGLKPSDIRLGIICMQDIADGDLVFTLTEIEEGMKGSFRSKDLDTTIYSEVFGGGGHKKASAFTLKTKDMKEAIEKVLNVIEEKGFVKA